jgi:hypothetical protein
MSDIITLKKIEQSKLAIREVKSLDEIKKVIDQGEALKAYARSAQMSAEIQADIAELNLRAERRLGEISKAMEKSEGKRTDLCTDNTEVTKTKKLYSAGIDIHTANKAEKLAEIPEEVFEEKIANAKEASEKITRSLFDEYHKKQKFIEGNKALERVAKYRRTGVKPKDWVDGADDELNRLADERDARLEAHWKKMAEKKEKEANYQDDPFPSQFKKYLDGLDSDAHRVVVCNKVMTICRQTMAIIQKKK